MHLLRQGKSDIKKDLDIIMTVKKLREIDEIKDILVEDMKTINETLATLRQKKRNQSLKFSTIIKAKEYSLRKIRTISSP